jgi:hypothetical protein
MDFSCHSVPLVCYEILVAKVVGYTTKLVYHDVRREQFQENKKGSNASKVQVSRGFVLNCCTLYEILGGFWSSFGRELEIIEGEKILLVAVSFQNHL